MVSVMDTINLCKCTQISLPFSWFIEPRTAKREFHSKKNQSKNSRVYTYLYVCSHDFYFDLFLCFGIWALPHTRIRTRKKLSRLCLCVSICNTIREGKKIWWSGRIACLWLMIIHFVSHNCRHMCTLCRHYPMRHVTAKLCDIVHAPHTHTHTNRIIKIHP